MIQELSYLGSLLLLAGLPLLKPKPKLGYFLNSFGSAIMTGFSYLAGYYGLLLLSLACSLIAAWRFFQEYKKKEAR